MSCQNVYDSTYLDNATGSRGYWADRDVNDKLVLPHSFDQVKIKPNDLVSAHVINRAFSKLYDNLLYIISKSRTPQSTVPDKQGYTEFLGTTSQSITGLIDTTSQDADLLSGASAASFQSSELSNQVTGVFFSSDQFDDINPNCGVVYVNTGDQTNIMTLQETLTGYTCDAVSNRVDNFTKRTFESDIVKTLVSEDMLYTAFGNSRVIYKHDVSGLRRNDRSYFDPNNQAQGKLLIDVIGADGGTDDPARFSNITTMACDELQNLYVVDVNQSIVVKMFDKNSNHITTYDVTEHIIEQTIQDMCHANNKFFVLTNTHVHEFTSKFVPVKSTRLTDTLQHNEQYKHITPSVENRNIVYVSTNHRVFKKFITRLDGGIGTFKYAGRDMHIDSDQMDISFVSVTMGDNNDAVYVGDRSRGVVFRFNDSVNYQQITTSTYQNKLTTLQDIMIKPDEYVNHIVYNKSIAKLFYNHALFGNSVRKKIVAEYNNRRYLEFKSLKYLLPQNIKTRSRQPTLKNFIGVNEVVMSAVINRTLDYIYKLQLDMLYDIGIEIADATQSPVMLESSSTITPDKKWTYGESGWSESTEQ